jgi:hypothetical protein
MSRYKRAFLAAGSVAVLVAGYGMLTITNSNASETKTKTKPFVQASAAAKPAIEQVKFALAPADGTMAACMPNMQAQVQVLFTEDQLGGDIFRISASGLRPSTPFTVFLNEKPADPFGAVEYFGDLNTDKYGNAQNSFKLIVKEAFASTLVAGKRVRVELNHVGMWFADPAGDDFCLGTGKGKTTPFDGDGKAGQQVMNSANSLPGTPIP